jgi:hypothetical protein
MLKRLVILLVFVGLVVSAASYLTGYLTLGAGGLSEGTEVTMSILTDTEVYHSGEIMEARVSAACSKDMDSAILRLYGIMDKTGKYRVNEERIVQMESPGTETVFLLRMPSCYGCAGISPGDYEIVSELLYNGETVGNCSKTITLVN